jgi:chromosomal replication initiation ATPase DnaA
LKGALDMKSSSNDVIAALAARGLLELLDEVCCRRGVTRNDVCGDGRSRAVAYARHELWSLIRDYPQRSYSYPEIARLVGRDHSTVFQGITAHRQRCLAGTTRADIDRSCRDVGR